ncbi:hypothetical protein ABZ424_03155 [Streptomyces sp. NPDC005790]|uniref:hypothetical protein n=1 Tax=Streptomyces sp. NPDC005790 TaxID=3154777 RepID=UPI003408DB58
MMPPEYRDFFIAAAGATGALTGLLFVALTLSPRHAAGTAGGVRFRTQASATLLVFTDALVLSTAALVPGVQLGWWATGGGVCVLVFALAALRVRDTGRHGAAGRPYALGAGLLCIAVIEIWAGIRLIGTAGDLDAVRVLCHLVVADLIFGVAEAWQLASMRDTGLLTSLRLLLRGEEAGSAPVPHRASETSEEGGR